MYFEFYLSALPSSFHGNPRVVTWVCWEIRHRQPLASTFRLQAVNSTLPEPLPPAAHPQQREGESWGLGWGCWEETTLASQCQAARKKPLGISTCSSTSEPHLVCALTLTQQNKKTDSKQNAELWVPPPPFF